MCGIVGVWKWNGDVPSLDVFNHARDTLSHRGPDGAGSWVSADGRLRLGHRRLAIVDLSPAGAQPMQSPDENLVVVFNGEIYNHNELRPELLKAGCKFRGHSDTEVLLAAYAVWGDTFLARLHGMFAFALYDKRRRRLLLARDRAGEKPLFYRHDSGGLHFASELKALLAFPDAPRVLDKSSLHHYLALGYVPGQGCMLEEYRKLPPGCSLAVEETGVALLRRYWDLPASAPASSGSVDELTEELELLLDKSVRRQMEADVPVGVLLSGGVDSSLVTALAARASSRPLHTYTIAFPGCGVLDESPFAARVAEHFGTIHTVLPGEAATPDLLDELVFACDEPMADSSLIPTALVARLVRRHCTVALGGDGGDELFGGYAHHRDWIRWGRVRRRLPGVLPDSIANLAAKLAPGVRGRSRLMRFADDPSAGHFSTTAFFDSRLRRHLLSGSHFSEKGSSPESVRADASSDRSSDLARVCAADFRTYMVDDILVKVDRAAMLNSLEVRAPWLDPDIIEFAFKKVPDSLKCDGERMKILPKCLCRNLLPRELDVERKQGFSIPLAKWMSGPWGTRLHEAVMALPSAVFDEAFRVQLLAGQARGRSNSERIYALAMLSLWMQRYRITIG